MRTSSWALGKHWSTHFTIFWHFTTKTTKQWIENVTYRLMDTSEISASSVTLKLLIVSYFAMIKGLHLGLCSLVIYTEMFNTAIHLIAGVHFSWRETLLNNWILTLYATCSLTRTASGSCQQCQRIQNHITLLSSSAWNFWFLVTCGYCLYCGSMWAPPPALKQ